MLFVSVPSVLHGGKLFTDKAENLLTPENNNLLLNNNSSKQIINLQE